MNLDFRSEQALAGARQFQKAQKIRKAQRPRRSAAKPSPSGIAPAEAMIAAAAKHAA